MRNRTVFGIIALAALSHTAGAQATSTRSPQDCIARQAAATTGGVTTSIVSVRLPAGNPVPQLGAGELKNFVVQVLVDTTGRPDSSTIQLPAELDSYSATEIRRVLPGWRFIPAMVGSCPVRQVVKVKFARH